MTAIDVDKLVIFDGRVTPGTWGEVLRWLEPYPANEAAVRARSRRARLLLGETEGADRA